MTDQGNWGAWPPQQGPDEPKPAENAGDAAREGGADNPDAPRGYGAPSYGAPSYGAPSYGNPGEGSGTSAADQTQFLPRQQPDQYGQQPGQYGQQPGQYGQQYGQPSYQQPTQQQPSYDQPTQQQPSYGGGYGNQGGGYGYGSGQDTRQQPVDPSYAAYGSGAYGSPTGGLPPTPAKKRSGGKIALVIGIVVVLVAGLGVGAWALFLRGGPAVTWQGKEVANPDAVLTEAQSDLDTLVGDVKGVKGKDTRCWFSVPKNPPKDTPDTDVSDTVYCGPALFVDGTTDKPYIPYGLAASGSDKVTLSINAKGTEAGATAVPADQELVRPDGASPPNGAGGLTVPEPPPAEENVFTTVTGVDVPDAPAGATMGALKGGVTIDKLGEIKRYGKGSDARSAPEGQKLIAFELADAPGDGDSTDGADSLDLTVSVDGQSGQEIPDLSATNVIAVPTDAKSVDLVTSADGVKQSLSLLTGKPGTSNIAVLARDNRFGSFTPPRSFAFTETGGGASASRPCTLSGSVAGLFYWADDEGTAKAGAPGNAILETDLKYTFSTDSPPPFTGSSAGDSATFEPSHLVLTLPGGQKTQAKLVANRTVFEVPAGFTEGTITVGGAYTNSNGITFTVTTPVSFKVSIPKS
ncbi:hypothetical protein ACXR2U_19175 [Jatrophihabitans sp. YIM 134969]